MLRVDCIKPDHLTRQVEAEHLLATVFVKHSGLHRATAHRIDRAKRVAGAEHMIAGAERPDVLDQTLKLGQFRLLVASGKASAGERAGTAKMPLVAIVGNRAGRLAQAASRVLQLSQARFKAGADDFLTVLDAQRSLYAAQQTQITLMQAEQVNRISLYKALGGGIDKL